MHFYGYRRRRLAVVLLCCIISILYISHDLYFQRGYWTKAISTGPTNASPDIRHTVTINEAASPHREKLPGGVLLVSALFPLKKSKHSMKSYKAWLYNFLQITTPIYIFLPKSLFSLLPQTLPDNLTVNSTYDTIFDLPMMKGMEPIYEANWLLDPEKDIHGPELYAIWKSKGWLLEEGYKNRDGEWDHIFWVDAGSFRGQSFYKHWPDVGRVRDAWAQTDPAAETRIFMPIVRAPYAKHARWKEEDGPIDQDISMASFFGGTPSAVHWYNSVYIAYHDYWLSKNLFVGKDQNLINALFLLFPSRFFTVFYDDEDPYAAAHQPYTSIFDQRWWRARWKDWHFAGAYAASRALGKCGSECYYYKFFFAAQGEREVAQDHWLGDHDGWDRWPFGTEHGMDRHDRCRLTKATGFEKLLSRHDRFGPGWTPPTRHLNVTASEYY
ncbi:hypothetical protein BDV98DRAFT_513603 [Pterulicium gracile]|uniref:Uncharacterized protein n=1 Tax=Pterulicium gracile TaxID=1884261 RepID=A0A5C3Q6X8_9AGAR|nr:hypothetical protein BDV98DRAFT_513603 [Pterula gracilis]